VASAPEPPKPEFSRLNTHNGATHRSSGHCTGCIFGQLQGHFMPLQEARRSQTRPSIWGSWWLPPHLLLFLSFCVSCCILSPLRFAPLGTAAPAVEPVAANLAAIFPIHPLKVTMEMTCEGAPIEVILVSFFRCRICTELNEEMEAQHRRIQDQRNHEKEREDVSSTRARQTHEKMTMSENTQPNTRHMQDER
jgi:hypothetical protein